MKCKHSLFSVTLHQIQGSIQQLLLKSDATAPDDQCEEDDPYVSLHKQNTFKVWKFNSKSSFEDMFWSVNMELLRPLLAAGRYYTRL